MIMKYFIDLKQALVKRRVNNYAFDILINEVIRRHQIKVILESKSDQ
jgi:hypothetical protein